jgi:beta-phosphoglucomutase-like phosphatase (HAD superfamily)
VDPKECLVLEDTEHGVNGAHTAGMKCIAFVTTLDKKVLEEAHADWIFNDYTEIPIPSII